MASKKKRKRPVPREGLDRPRNGGQWTEARFTSFVKSALRGARWPQKYECIKKAFIGNGINPATGRKCKLHLCPTCKETFPQNQMNADHNIPVVGAEGFTSWDDFISRLFVEGDGFTATCKPCHKKVTEAERLARAEAKKLKL